MRETWYVLESGEAVNPAEVGYDDKGRMVHTSGAFVAMRGDTPSSRGVDVDESASREREEGPGAETEPPAKEQTPAKDLKPAAPRTYKTREVKGK